MRVIISFLFSALLLNLFTTLSYADVDIDDSNANLAPFSCPATNRERPYVADHTIKADNGALLRGEHILGLGINGWGSEKYLRSFRDDYHLNTVRFIGYRDLRTINGKVNWKSLEQITPIMDEQVRLAAKLGMYIIIDYHPLGHDGQMGELSFWQQNSIDFWTQIAPRYKDCPHVIYEAWNELARGGQNDATVDKVSKHFTLLHNLIRSHAPKTHVIVWSNMGPKDSLLRVKDKIPIDYTKASISFHGYSMMNQTNVFAGETEVSMNALEVVDKALARNDNIPYFMTEYTYPNGWRSPDKCSLSQKYVEQFNKQIKLLEDRKVSWIMLNLKRSLEEHGFWKQAETGSQQCNLPIPFDIYWPKDPKAIDYNSSIPTLTSQPSPTDNPPTTTLQPLEWDLNSDNYVNLFDLSIIISKYTSPYNFPSLKDLILAI